MSPSTAAPPAPAPWSLTRRDALRVAASCAACILAAQVPAAEVDYPALIDIAGRQRMLTQRIVKAYCQIGLDVAPELSHQQLRSAVRRFDAQLAELARRAPTTSAHRAVEQVEGLWRPFRRVALGTVHADGAQWLARNGEPLQATAHEVVGLLEQSSGTPQARLVNLAGRQRMLSQRLAKLYMLRAWHVAPPGTDETLEATAQEFAAALGLLLGAPENTPEIGEALDEVALQWQWLQAALAMQGESSHALLVAETSEAILAGMERAVGLYAKGAGR